MSDSNQALIRLYIDAAREALEGAQYNLEANTGRLLLHVQSTIQAHNDRAAVEALIQQLLQKQSLQVQRVILYGSKARHDDTPESDIDLLVLVADDAWPVREQILTIGAQLSLEHDVLFNVVAISRARWEWMRQIRHPLYRSIAAEGIELTSEPMYG